MYQVITQTGESFQDALDKAKAKFTGFQYLTHRTISLGGFLGFFAKEGIEITGFIRHDILAQEKAKVEEEKKRILALAKEKQVVEEKKDEHLKQVLEEVKSLRVQLETLPQSKTVEHPTLDQIDGHLEENGFSKKYRKMILDRCRKEFTLEGLEEYAVVESSVVSWIAETIRISEDKPASKPRVFILVGPTGVGKTTTIAKLAAVYGLGFSGRDRQRVSMITIDNYRIGAKVQIESYGEIMGFPVACVENFEALQEKIELQTEMDLILVDTIGKSPKDFMKLAEMRKLLEACGKNAEVHLAVSSITKTQDAAEIFQQFEPFGYRSVILTKLDETSGVGNLISLLWEKGKSLSFLTNGQSVPQDIRRADPAHMIENLSGFSAETVKKWLQEQKEVRHG